jgi:hypothetical protein
VLDKVLHKVCAGVAELPVTTYTDPMHVSHKVLDREATGVSFRHPISPQCCACATTGLVAVHRSTWCS